jgi:ribosomal subunit interface protein
VVDFVSMKTRLSTSDFDLTLELEKYANIKLASLTRKVPRRMRTQAYCDVHFMQVRRKGAKFNTCVIGLSIDGTKLRSEETTLHMYTSLDIAVVHVERQLNDYAAKHRHHVSTRLRSRLRQHFRRGQALGD